MKGQGKFEKAKQLLLKHQDTLLQVLKTIPKDYKHDEQIYKKIMEIVKFIREESSKIQALGQIKDAVLLVGNTGNGKSTLLTYLLGSKLNIKNDGSLISSQTEVAIGDGSGSTTLLPNIKQLQFGTVLDLAGDLETRGMIADLFNVLWKSKLKLNSSKIVLVSSEAAFSAQNSYGKNFKDMIQKNSKFLGNLNNYSQNAILVLTCAQRNKKGLGNAIQKLRKCINHADQILKPYEQFFECLISSNRVLPFAKPDPDAEQGEIYEQPQHNKNQKDNILNMISRIDFNRKQLKCEISSDSNQRQTLLKLFQILLASIRCKIEQAIEEKRTIHGIQLKIAFQIFQNLKDSLTIDVYQSPDWRQQLENAIKQNNLLKLTSSDVFGQQLLENIGCILRFLKTDPTSPSKHVNFLSDDASKLLTESSNQISQILAQNGQNFRKVSVGVKPTYPQFETVNQMINQLKNQYKKQAVLQKDKSDPDSQYYEDQKYKQHIRTDTQQYQDQQQYQHPITKYKTISYTDQQPYSDTEQTSEMEPYQETESYKQPVTKFMTKTKTEYIPYHTSGNAFLSVVSLGFAGGSRSGYNTRQVSYQEAYTDYETRTRKVTKYRPVKKTKKVTRYRPVAKTRQQPYETTETRTRTVTKTRQVPIYEDKVRRKFLQKNYNKENDSVKNQIGSLTEKINLKLDKHCGNQCIRYVPEEIQADESGQPFPQEFRKMIRKWEKVEAVCYGQAYKGNRLVQK